jgi:hypothetical protein
VKLAEVGELAGVDFGDLVDADVLAKDEAARPRLPLRSVEEARP